MNITPTLSPAFFEASVAIVLAAPAVISLMRFCGSFTTSESVDSLPSLVTVLKVSCFGIKPWKSSDVRTAWSSGREIKG